MSNSTLASTLILVAALVSLGLVSGLLYFRAMRRTAELLACRQGWLRPVAHTVVRIVCAIGVLAVIAQLGAIAVFANLAGFLLARTIALRAVRRTC